MQPEMEQEAPCLPLEVLASIIRLTKSSAAVPVRSTCRDWRATHDSVIAGLVCTPSSARLNSNSCTRDSSSPVVRGNGVVTTPQHVGLAMDRPPLLPLVFPKLERCKVHGTAGDGLQRLISELAVHSSRLETLTLMQSPGITALPESVQLLRGLRQLTVGYTALATLPPGMDRLTALQVLELSHNAIVQLPASLSGLTALTSLRVDHNLLTELPCLPACLLELDVGWNRLKALGMSDLLRLTAITSLSAEEAFSHRPHGEGSPTIGALVRLRAARGAELTLQCDSDVMELVRIRSRLWGV